MKFEYKYLELRMGLRKHTLLDLHTNEEIHLPGGNGYGYDLVEAFNRFGSEGWELVSSHTADGTVYEYIFKRPKSGF